MLFIETKKFCRRALIASQAELRINGGYGSKCSDGGGKFLLVVLLLFFMCQVIKRQSRQPQKVRRPFVGHLGHRHLGYCMDRRHLTPTGIP